MADIQDQKLDVNEQPKKLRKPRAPLSELQKETMKKNMEKGREALAAKNKAKREAKMKGEGLVIKPTENIKEVTETKQKKLEPEPQYETDSEEEVELEIKPRKKKQPENDDLAQLKKEIEELKKIKQKETVQEKPKYVQMGGTRRKVVDSYIDSITDKLILKL